MIIRATHPHYQAETVIHLVVDALGLLVDPDDVVVYQVAGPAVVLDVRPHGPSTQQGAVEALQALCRRVPDLALAIRA